jgi:hypothetical protein
LSQPASPLTLGLNSGSEATDDHLSTGGSLTGPGNLIIGYDEVGSSLNAGDRGGSHNLVIGRWHRFTASTGFGAFGGLVAGEANTIMFEAASVSGGQFNSATFLAASVSGGQNNFANGANGSVSGGSHNASSNNAAVSGGLNNTASGGYASVCGGTGNTAAGYEAVVIGGSNITDNNSNSIAPGAPLNYP